MSYPVGQLFPGDTRGAQAGGGLRDPQLLERFVSFQDEEAFATLVQRHGPMVLGVCQRVLGNSHDAADAFQGCFLVLARRARAIRRPESLAAWLCGVAYRVARKMKTTACLRRTREKQLPARPAMCPPDLSWRELLAAVDEEMQSLPDKHRQPLVLCFLEGLSQEEAAEQLGWVRGTLKRRLERGRELLRQRLIRRGLALGVAAFAMLSACRALAMPIVPNIGPPLARAAVLFGAHQSVPGGLIKPTVVTLANAVLKTKAIGTVLSAIVILLGLSAAGALVYSYLAFGRACVCVTVAGDDEDALGSAQVVSSVQDGSPPVSQRLQPTLESRIRGNKRTIRLNTRANPMQMDFTMELPRRPAGYLPGIYEFERKSLRICLEMCPGALDMARQRPRQFSARRGRPEPSLAAPARRPTRAQPPDAARGAGGRLMSRLPRI
jgi:RNA polymerase sigma factor (sigma-70 family)